MKYTLLIASLCLAVVLSHSQTLNNTNDDLETGSFVQSVREIEVQFDVQFGDASRKGTGYKPFKRFEWFWKRRLTPSGELPSSSFLTERYHELKDFRTSSNFDKNLELKNEGMVWKSLGPDGNPTYNRAFGKMANGRVNVITPDPNNENTLWAGSAAGGVFKSINKGQSWTQMAYDDFLSLAVSHIAVDPNNSEIIYVATGDYNPLIILNGDIRGGATRSTFPSIGVMKSTDGGSTWRETAFNSDSGPFINGETSFVSTIVVHPDNSSRIILATDDGLLESLNSGASFNKISDGTFRDIKLNPVDRNILHCAVNTTGSSRFVMNNFDLTNRSFIGQGATVNNCNRIKLAVSPDGGGNTVYAIASRTDQRMEGFYKSTDMGQSWNKVNTQGRDFLVRDISGNPQDAGQGWYDLALAVNPTDADEVFIGGINIWKTTDGGQTFSQAAHWTHQYENQGVPGVHADIHYLQYSLDGNRLYVTNDGGIEYTDNKGASYTDANNGIVATQYYDISVGRRNGQVNILGGAQDNGTSFLTPNGWSIIYGGDGMRTHVSFEDNYIYFSTQNGNIFRTNLNNGASATIGSPNSGLQNGEWGEWETPFVVSPHDPSVLYVGYINLWKSENRGSSWSKLTNFNGNTTLDDIAVSPSDPNVMYFVASGGNSRIYKTIDGGNSWNIIAESNDRVSGFVQDIAVDPIDPNTFYYCVSGFDSDNKVWQVRNNTFKNYSSGLPNFSANALFVDRDRNRVFVGTDVGVFVKEGSSSFKPFNNGMPNCVISDLEPLDNNTKLFAGTHGSGVWETDLLDCSEVIAPTINVEGELTLCPNDSIMLEYSGIGAIKWNTGATSKQIYVSEPGEYYAIRSTADGCTAASNVAEIIPSTIKTPGIVGRPKNDEFCEGDTITLKLLGQMFDKYLWNGVEGGRTLEVTEPGDYTLTVVEAGGCTATTETVTLTMNFAPAIPKVTYDENKNLLTATFSSTFQWFKDGVEIDGAQSRTFKPFADGFYSVEVYTSSGCGSMSEPVKVTGTSVEEINLTSSVIFPNPSAGQITFRNLPNTEPLDLQIYNIEGRLVFTKSGVTNGNSLSLDLPPSNYIVKFGDGINFYTTSLNIK